jgi:UDP-N-acetylmuramoylalanine-D-glutamate ligase
MMDNPGLFERFNGRRGLVMGLGVFGGGIEAAKFLSRRCSHVLVTDLRDEDVLSESVAALDGLPVEFRLGGHRRQDFEQADVVIHSPAVRPDHPLLQAAREHGAEVTMEMSLFIEACPAKTIGITGSNGKTTTALLAYEMLCQVMGRAQPEFEGRWSDKDPEPRKVLKLVSPGGEMQDAQSGSAGAGRVWLGGNCGEPLINRLEEMAPEDVVVLELSSFQLQDWHRIGRSCDIALITNITPNHLDWHRDMDEYIRAKAAVFEYQPDGRRCVILNLDDRRCCDLLELHPKLKSERTDAWTGPMLAPKPTGPKPVAKGQDGPQIASLAMAMGEDQTEHSEDAIIGYSVNPELDRGVSILPALTRFVFAGGRFSMRDGKEVEADPDTLCEWRRGFAFVGLLSRDDLKLPGLFNWSNAAAALSAASAAVGDPRAAVMLGRAARTFRGAEHRLEYCGEVNGARCYNDSIATTPEATMAALSAFDRGVHLLLGGSDKGLSYQALADAIASHSGIKGVYVQGANAVAIAESVKGAVRFATFDAACEAALAALEPGDAFLMSPASASFYEYAPNNRFTNFEHRGRHFKALVEAHASGS